MEGPPNDLRMRPSHAGGRQIPHDPRDIVRVGTSILHAGAALGRGPPNLALHVINLADTAKEVMAVVQVLDFLSPCVKVPPP